VESHQDGKEAVEYLKERARGRSSFVPLQEIKLNGREAKVSPGSVPLSSLITVSEKFRSVSEFLLGDTVLVTDLDTAISAWKNNASRATAW
jgi:chromosome segregation protein